jgi:hypothetical protein
LCLPCMMQQRGQKEYRYCAELIHGPLRKQLSSGETRKSFMIFDADPE